MVNFCLQHKIWKYSYDCPWIEQKDIIKFFVKFILIIYIYLGIRLFNLCLSIYIYIYKQVIYFSFIFFSSLAMVSCILENSWVDLTPRSDFSEPIEWWLQGTTDGANKPKKNQLIRFATAQTSQKRIGLLDLQPSRQTHCWNLAHCFRETTRGGASS